MSAMPAPAPARLLEAENMGFDTILPAAAQRAAGVPPVRAPGRPRSGAVTVRLPVRWPAPAAAARSCRGAALLHRAGAFPTDARPCRARSVRGGRGPAGGAAERPA